MNATYDQVEADERAAIEDEGCGRPIHAAPYAVPAPEHEVPEDPIAPLERQTADVRRFLGIGTDEPIELTAIAGKQIWVAQCSDLEEHVRLLETVERGVRRFMGAYMLVNGPIDPNVCARYLQNSWVYADNGRVSDPQIATRRAIFIDVDPVRLKGISATDAERAESLEVATAIKTFLVERLGKNCIGFGSSGNGYYILIAIEPVAPTQDQAAKISRFLGALQCGFGTPEVSIDKTVVNPARLMSAPGTWKRKGQNTEGRPHRETSFIAPLHVERVPLVEVAA